MTQIQSILHDKKFCRHSSKKLQVTRSCRDGNGRAVTFSKASTTDYERSFPDLVDVTGGRRNDSVYGFEAKRKNSIFCDNRASHRHGSDAHYLHRSLSHDVSHRLLVFDYCWPIQHRPDSGIRPLQKLHYSQRHDTAINRYYSN